MKKKFLPFWLKLFSAYSIVIILTFSLILPIVFPRIIAHSKASIQDRLDAQSAHVIDNLETQLDTMRSIYIKLKCDDLLQEAFLAPDIESQHRAQRYIIKTINTLSNIWNPSIYIELYDCNSGYFYNSRYLSLTSMRDTSWMENIDMTHGMFNFYVVNDINNDGIRCLTIGDTIHKSLLYDKLAYFSVSIILSALENQILPPDYSDDTLQIMVAEDGSYILGDKIVLQDAAPSMAEGSLLLNGQTYIISKATSDTYGFTHYILVPDSEAYQDLKALLGVTLGAVFGVILIAVFISFVLARQITLPINRLTDMVTHYNGDAESQSVIHDLKLNNEFSILNQRLILMSEKISSLIHDVYQQKITQQQLQLQTLYKSINPHFIYNILDTIQWELRLNETDSAIKTLYAFSHYLRNTLVMKQKQMTLSEIRSSIQDYCDLRHIVSDQVLYECRIPEELDNYLLPSMVVLPLVENCFVHAFPDESSAPCKITVSAHLTDRNLVICVEDNGCGISPEDLQIIERILEAPMSYELQKGSTRFFAVKNIQLRIQLSCGKEYGLKIFSPGVGTRAVLYLPIQKEATESEG